MEPVQIVSIMERIMGANPVILLKSHAGQPKLKYTATAAGGKDTFATPMLCQTWFDAILALRDFPISEGPVCIPSELTEAIERIFEGMEKYLVLSKLHNSTFSIITVPSTAKVPLLIAKQITGAINEFAGQFPAP